MIATAVAPLIALSLLVGPVPASRACVVEDATLTWGFKESFRSYISGTIANGEWTVADGATYETPEFGFHGGAGDFGEVSFEGAIRFTGHGGILDTTVANPTIEWGGGSGTLYLDVSGTTQDGDPVDEQRVPFADLTVGEPVAADGRVSYEDVTATLTDEGAEAFGTYESGEELDPLTIQLTFESACTQSELRTTPTWPMWIAAVAGAATVAVVTVLVVRRRRGDPSSAER